MSQRTKRVGDLIRRELAEVIVSKLQDPRVRLATVADVRVTPDLRRAVVRMSILGDEEARRAGLEGLQHARGFLRTTLARRLRTMKIIPDLVFELDRGAEHSRSIEDLLESLHDENRSA
ncbi:MAG: 30S ribosome-binding factor RbfA [bacterium]|nr:30S ribosome-binding factor RbfA [bacterium]